MNTRIRPLLLLLAVGLSYGTVLVDGHMSFAYDDVRFVRDNAYLRDLGNTPSYFTDLRTVDPGGWGGIYRPLRTLDFAIDHALFGASPWWYHFRNILYFGLCVLLVDALFRRWGAPPGAALLGSLVFAVHPVQVESVAWITSRGDVLFLLFFLAGLLLHARDEGFSLSFLGAGALLVLALFSKEEAVVFVGAALLADFFFRDGRRPGRTLGRWPRYLVYAALAGLYAFLWLRLHDQAHQPHWHLLTRWGGSFAGTLLTMSRGFVYYVRLLLLPVDMAQDWYLKSVGSPDLLTLLCAAAVLAAIGFALTRAFRGGGTGAFAVLWFLVAIFPVSNIPGPVGIPTAERFLLLPMVGVSLALGTLLFAVYRRGRLGRALALVPLVAMVAVSADRARVWTSDRALWESTLARFESPRALDWTADHLRMKAEDLQARARELRDHDELAQAQQVGERAADLLREALSRYTRENEIWASLPVSKGQVAVTRANRGIVLYDLGRFQEALDDADAALAVDPTLHRAQFSRALALYGLGLLREAAGEVDRALKQEYVARYRAAGAGIYLQLAKKYAEPVAGVENRALSLAALRRSWELLPDPKKNAGAIRAINDLEQEYRTTLAALRKQIDQDPAAAGEAYLNLAVLYARYGMWEKADRTFDQLLARIAEKRKTAVLYAKALYYWQMRDDEEGYRRAARIYRQILEADPDFAEAKKQLATCEEHLSWLVSAENEGGTGAGSETDPPK